MSSHFDPPELPIAVPDMFFEVVANTETAILPTLRVYDTKIQQLHGLCCPPDEMIETLLEMNNPQSQQFKKYPLIGLFEDITVREGRADAYYGTTTWNLIIATQTEATYKSQERTQKTFRPILRPILKEFKRQLKLSPYFANDKPLFPADIAERKRWGRDGLYGKDGNLFADRIDAIEIMNLELTLRWTPATTPFKNFR